MENNQNKDPFWTTVGKIIFSFLMGAVQGKREVQVSIPIPEEIPVASQPIENKQEIDWTKATSMITQHISVGEAIALHAWNRLATEQDGLTPDIKEKIIKTCQMAEKIRVILNSPLNIHSLFRSQEYNRQVLHSIPLDVHAMGLAVDFDANSHHTIEEAKAMLRPHLADLDIRMERDTTNWIHCDWHSIGPSGREFKA